MMIYIAVLIVFLVSYAYFELKRLNRAISITHSTPDQTGDFEIGKAVKERINVLITGDSIAAGTGITEFEQSLGGRLALKLSENYHVFLRNQAEKSSWTSDIALDKFSGEWDMAIIIVGSNELIHHIKIRFFKISLNHLLRELTPRARHIYLVGPGDVASAKVFPLWFRFRMRTKQNNLARTMGKIAKEHRVTYINPLRYRAKRSYFSKDGLHPNALGHKKWFEAIWEAVSLDYK